MDGELDEAAWAAATVMPLPYEWAPTDNAPPPVETECLVTFDDDNLYVGFRAHDPQPRQIRAYLADRDTAFLTTPSASTSTPSTTSGAPTSSGSTRSGCRSTPRSATWTRSRTSPGMRSGIPRGRLRRRLHGGDRGPPQADPLSPHGREPDLGLPRPRTYPRSVVTGRDLERPAAGVPASASSQAHRLPVIRRAQPGGHADGPTKQTDVRRDVTRPLETGDVEAEAGLSVRGGSRPT